MRLRALLATAGICLALAACNTVQKPQDQPKIQVTLPAAPLVITQPPITFTAEQWQCGPKSPSLPSDEVLRSWTSRHLFDAYVNAYQWGERCSNQLDTDHTYYDGSLKQRADELAKIKAK